MSLYSAQLNANALIMVLRDNAIHAGVNTPAGRVDSDEISIRNLLGVYQAAALALITQQPFAADWRMSDNTVVSLSAMGVVGMGNAVLAHIQACYQRSWALKELVSNAATEEEVALIEADECNAGWPS